MAPVPAKLRVCDFEDNRAVIQAAGILNPRDVEPYVATLEQYGFETPLLLLGLKGKLEYMTTSMSFKPGHAICLQQFLSHFETEM